MEEKKYYRVKFKKSGNQWLTNLHCNINYDFWYSVESRAMVFSSKLFKDKNRLTDFLKDKEYEKILVTNIDDIKHGLIVEELIDLNQKLITSKIENDNAHLLPHQSSDSIILQMENGKCTDIENLVKEYLVNGHNVEILSIIWSAKLLGKVADHNLSEFSAENIVELKKLIIHSMLLEFVKNQRTDNFIGLPSYFELEDEQFIATNRIIIADETMKKAYLLDEYMKEAILNQIICDRVKKEEFSQLIEDIVYFIENLDEEYNLGEFTILLGDEMEALYNETNASIKTLYILYSVLVKLKNMTNYFEIERLISSIIEEVDKSEVIEAQKNDKCFELLNCGLELLDMPESIVSKIKEASSCVLIDDLWILTEHEVCEQLGLTNDELAILLLEMDKIALYTGQKIYTHRVERCKELINRSLNDDAFVDNKISKFIRCPMCGKIVVYEGEEWCAGCKMYFYKMKLSNNDFVHPICEKRYYDGRNTDKKRYYKFLFFDEVSALGTLIDEDNSDDEEVYSYYEFEENRFVPGEKNAIGSHAVLFGDYLYYEGTEENIDIVPDTGYFQARLRGLIYETIIYDNGKFFVPRHDAEDLHGTYFREENLIGFFYEEFECVEYAFIRGGKYYKNFFVEEQAYEQMVSREKEEIIQYRTKLIQSYKQKYSEHEKPSREPWATKYYDYPCPYCGKYTVRNAKWEDKQFSTAFWGFFSPKLHAHYKCDSCNRMWE